MTNGLSITVKEFESLPQKQQLRLLYENTEQLKVMVANYNSNRKFNNWIVGFNITSLAAIFGILLKHISGG